MNDTLNIRGRLVDVSRPVVMGILNATPDSFFAGSRMQTESEIAARACQIVEEGGTMIDVGAFSTRPGAAQVTEQEEAERLRRALRIVRSEQPDVALSVDTFRPAVAQMAVEEFGADIINDVSGGCVDGAFGGEQCPNSGNDGGEYPEMFKMVARLRTPYILMSAHGELREMLLFFAAKVQQLRDLGQKDIILDPGFGFGKTVEQNYRLMAGLEKLSVMELPLLVGVSRKSMIWKLLGTTPDEALNGTTALHTAALLKGASILRVHDVKAAVETVSICQQLKSEHP